MKQNPLKKTAVIKRAASVTFTFMCPWEWTRQEGETFWFFQLHFGERPNMQGALGSSLPHFPIWRMDLGVDRRMGCWRKKKKKKGGEKKKGAAYVCLFLFISSQPNRSTSSAAWLKLILLKMSRWRQFIYTRTWRMEHDCSHRIWQSLEKCKKCMR